MMFLAFLKKFFLKSGNGLSVSVAFITPHNTKSLGPSIELFRRTFGRHHILVLVDFSDALCMQNSRSTALLVGSGV